MSAAPRPRLVTPHIFPNEAAVTTSLFRRGLKTLHLRKPDATAESVARLLDDVPSEFHPRIMLHHHHHLADSFKLKGLHYPSKVCPRPPIQELPDPRMQQSTSFHTLDEVELTGGWGPGLGYAFLSPIYDSISKKGYASAGFDQQRLSSALDQCRIPIIALGGITADRIGQAAAAGFDGAAVLGAVWQAQDPVAALLELQHACDRLSL